LLIGSCSGSAGFAERWDRLACLSGDGLGRRGADNQIGGPAIGKDLPCAGGLSHQDDQVFSTLFAAFAHGYGHEHLATAEIESNVTEHFDAQRFHLNVAQSGFEQRDKKFPDRRQAANRRKAGAYKSGVGGVELEQIVNVPGVAGLRPVLHHLAGTGFGAAAGRARGTRSTTAKSRGLGRGSGRAAHRFPARDKMMIVVVNVMLAGSLSSIGIARDRLGRGSAPGTKASARRERTSADGAGAARFVRVTVCRQILCRRAATGHALDRFHGGSDRLRIRLRPAKVAREPLKKLFDLLAFGGLVLFSIVRIRLVCGHGNLIVDIVGEFGR